MTGCRPMTVCSTPGCPELTAHPSGRCDAHVRQRSRNQAQQRRAMGDTSMDVYSTPAWRRTRRRYLRANPTCTTCGAPSTIPDHVIPRKQLIARGVTNPDDLAWLQPLCKPCHDRKTSAVDGGFGRAALNDEQR